MVRGQHERTIAVRNRTGAVLGRTRFHHLPRLAEIVGEIGIDARDNGFMIIAAVLPERYLSDLINRHRNGYRAFMREGLYKVEMHTVHGSRRGVLYVYDGKMMGGNSAFAFIGTFRDCENGGVLVDISTMRHHDDPKFQPLFK